MKASVDFRQAEDGQYYFVVKAGNGEIVSVSETYTREQSARKGFDALTRAVIEIECEQKRIKRGVLNGLKILLGIK